MVNSREKGARGERKLSKFLQGSGVDARRGQQFSGSPGSPDIVHNLPGIHIEVKNTERLRLFAAYEQACRDAGDKIPTVWHKKNRGKWMVTLSAEDFLKFRLRLSVK